MFSEFICYYAIEVEVDPIYLKIEQLSGFNRKWGALYLAGHSSILNLEHCVNKRTDSRRGSKSNENAH